MDSENWSPLSRGLRRSGSKESGYYKYSRRRRQRRVERLEERCLLSVVSVIAGDAFAVEGDSTGSFVFSRDGSLTAPLEIGYSVTGSATAGSDYATLAGSVTIPTGMNSISVPIVPFKDALTESTESVTVTLGSVAGYSTDLGAATVSIRDWFDGAQVAALVPLSETFALHSLPGARHTLYLDFDGGTVNDSYWSSSTINVNPFSLEGTSAFSDFELATIQRAWEVVAEDYRPFGLDVTTELPNIEKLRKTSTADTEWGLRVMIGDPIEYSANATGRAQDNSFNANYDAVCWVDLSDPAWGNSSNKSARTIGGLISHEAGHTMNLHHDGTGVANDASYYDGQGTQEARWAPIMGNVFGSWITGWSKGDYPNANQQQDDLAVLTTTNGFTYRPDDHADSAANATPLSQVDADRLVGEGVIERTTDFDWFSFNSNGGLTRVSVEPNSLNPNVDLKAELYDSAMNLVATSDPTNQLAAGINATLTAGTYFVRVTGTGNLTWSTGGYDDYASLGAYAVAIGGDSDLAAYFPAPGQNSTPMVGTATLNDVSHTTLTAHGATAGTDSGAIWPVSWPASSSLNLNNYLTFTVTPTSGRLLDLDQLQVGLQAYATTSTSSVALRSSLDNFAANIDGTSTFGAGLFADLSFNLRGVADSASPVELRLYVWGASSGWRSVRNLVLEGRTVSSTPVAPVAKNDVASTALNTAVAISVLGNDSDANGDVLSVAAITTQPAHGTVTINGNGTVTYTPTTGYVGTDNFNYTASDGTLTSNIATVWISVVDDVTPPPPPVGVAAQYVVNQYPRLQLGDAPLTGYAGSSLDQVALLWQTQSGGTGTQDSFTVQYRLAGTTNSWQSSGAISQTATGVQGRIVHQATITGLQWDTNYEYRVRHLRAGGLVQEWRNQFHSRLQAGDTSNFSFVAYGDSAAINGNTGFRNVQARINALDPKFAVLLGDNIYESGLHTEADARFDPDLNPEAATWMAGHIDYLGLGNHDVIYSGNNGRESEESFAVPIPVAGVDSPVAPPATERAEHSFSWDYGDVHFVTFDTNSYNDSARRTALLDYVVADLNASHARWKIVYGHHPIAAAPDKATEWNSTAGRAYYDAMVSRLTAAGADLFLAGHSHTFSWTYPLTGRSSNGTITYASGAYNEFSTNVGLPQVVSGVGGKEVRTDTYTDPYVAAGWSAGGTLINGIMNPSSQRAENGIAKIDVTSTQLTVSYVAADDGAILGSFTLSDNSPSSNHAPVALNDAATTAEDVPVTINVQANDSDADANSLSTSLVTQPTHGTATANADGTINYTPGLNYNGTDSFSYRVNDGFTNSNIATVSLNISAMNDAPTATNDAATTTQNNSVTISVLSNDSDIEGSTLTPSVVASPANGSVIVNANGTLTYSPAANFQGTDSFTYLVSDGSLNSNVATVSVTVTRSNVVPVASNDSATIDEDTTATLNVLSNDSDADNDPLTISIASWPAHATAVLNANGTITITPQANFSGSDSFTYRVSDGLALSNVATVSLTISPINDVPLAVNDALNVTLNTTATLNVLSNDSDADGNVLTPSIETSPAHGTATVNANGTITIVPTTGYLGSDSFTYRVSDGTTTSNVATVSLTISDQTQPVTLTFRNGVGSYVGTEDTTLTASTPSTVNGASTLLGVDGSPVEHLLLKFSNIFGVGAGLIPIGATIQSATLSFEITDPGDAPNVHRMLAAWNESNTWNSLNTGIQNDGVEAATSPEATFSGTTGTMMLDVTSALSDWAQNPATNHGWAFLPTGSNGVDIAPSEVTTITSRPQLSVTYLFSGTPVNHAPVAVADSANTTRNVPVTISVQANDSDLDLDALTTQLALQPGHGTATVNANGTVTYAPTSGYVGNDSFSYFVSDGSLSSGTVTVDVTVADVVATFAHFDPIGPQGASNLAGTTSIAGVTVSSLSRVGASSGNNTDVWPVYWYGSTSLDASQYLTFTVTPTATALADFSKLTISFQEWVTGTSNVAVRTSLDGFSTNVGGVQTIADTDSVDVSFDLSTLPFAGGATVFRIYVFDAVDGTSGWRDIRGSQWNAGKGVLLEGATVPNVAPVAVNDSVTTSEDNPLVVNVLANDSDPDGQSLVPTVLTQPSHGTATVNANGTISYTPSANYNGLDSFTYRVSDGAATSNTATVSLTVTAVNDVPVAVADSATTTEGTSVIIIVLANDSDADGQSLTPNIVAQPSHGSVTVNANGSLTYAPASGYFGSDSFTYAATDGSATSNTVAVNLTVNELLLTLASFDPVGAQGSASLAGTTSVAGVTVSNLSRVGTTYGTNTNLWPCYWTGSLNVDPAQYLTFSVTTVVTSLADFSKLTVSFYEWVGGTSNAAVRSSLDGFTSNIGGIQTITDTGNADVTFNLTSLPNAAGTVTFRVYVFDAVDATTGYRDIRSSAASNGKGVLLEGKTVANTAPVANNDSTATNEDTAVTVSVLGNDSDADSNPLTPAIVSQPSHGTATVNANGTISYTPAANFNGSDSFTYRVSDGGLNSNTATVSISIAAVNDAPTAIDNVFATAFQTLLDVPAASGVLANDSDVDGNALTASLVSGPTHGTLTLNANGSFQYAPAAGYVGTDSFSYTASDGLTTSQATVTITVNPPPDDHSNLLNSTATNITLSNGTRGTGSASGTFEIAGDRDVFKVTLATGQLTAMLNGVSGLSTVLRLFNSAGTQVAIAGPNTSNTVTLNVSAGTYYLSAGSNADALTGSFTLSVTHREKLSTTWQQGSNGYSGASDTYVSGSFPTSNFATGTMNQIDYTSATLQEQSLLQFKNLFGSGTNQIPFGSEIVTATLTIYITNGGNRVNLHRMLVSWTDTATWNSLTSGIQTNGVEAVTTPDSQTATTVPTGWLNVDVKSSVTAWLNNPNKNFGWALLPTGTDGVDWYSSNNSVTWVPRLSIDYYIPNGDQHTNAPTSAATALPIANNASTAFGTLETAGDRDVFQFVLTQASSVTLNLASFGASTLNTYLRLYSSTGMLVAENNDSNSTTNSKLTLSLSAGTYYVSVASDLDTGLGDYWLDLLIS